MKKYFIVLFFFGLLEYQVLFHRNTLAGLEFHYLNYSAVTAGGLIILCLYQLFKGVKDFGAKRLETGKKKNLVTWMVVVATYLAIIVGGSILTDTFEGQFISLLTATTVGLVGVSICEAVKRRKKKGKIPEKADHFQSTRVNAFTIPVIYLYVVNFLVAAGIGHNIAFQFILILSCMILYDNLAKEERFVEKFKRRINDFELRHYVFHRWSKYFNFFLGTWYFMSLHMSGVISLYAMLGLLFLYMCIFFTVLLRISYHFNIHDFAEIIIAAGTLTAIPALAYSFTDWIPPAFAVAAVIFFGFDLSDIYWHSKHFAKEHRTSPVFWTQKGAVYILVLIFIWQLQTMGTNPAMSIDNVYTSVFGAPERGIELPSDINPIINVSDIENTAHARGE